MENYPEVLDVRPAVYSRPIAVTNEQLEKNWRDGKDFQIWMYGPYCSIRDTEMLKANGVKSVMIWRDSRAGVEVKL